MDSDDDDLGGKNARVVTNQPYDESLEVPDAEEVASNYTPSPRAPGVMDRGSSLRGSTRGSSPPESDSDEEDEETSSEDDFVEGGSTRGGSNPSEDDNRLDGMTHEAVSNQSLNHSGKKKPSAPRQEEEEDDDDEEEDGSEESSSEDDESESEHGGPVEGAYDPADYDHLPVSADIKEMFQYITRYTPQSIELEHKLKPFIPDFIPAVGDIDAFIKIGRPDTRGDTLGLTVLDEPCAKQSDPTVLDLQLRAISKQTTTKAMQVRSLPEAQKQPRAINNWIDSISELHRSKPPPNVHYSKPMPDVDSLMQEWPSEFEELLKSVGLPSADLDCTLAEYTELVCSVLDIPIYKSKIQSLHVLFTLYSAFKNSQHFRSLAEGNRLDNALKKKEYDEDTADMALD